MADLLVVGKEGNKDKQNIHIVTGKLDYAGDNLLGKKLFTRAKLSPHAHAKILSIDTSKAEALEGVEAVCTFADNPVFSDTILYHGQEVAAVAAVDEATAARAIPLIDVEYEVLPHVIDPDDAAAPGAPLTGVRPDSNTQPSERIRGDMEAGMAAADNIYEGTVGWTNYFQHGSIESCTGVAHWVGDHVYAWSSSQNPFGHRNNLSSNLEMPLNKVHLISHGSGSGFGDKHSSQWNVTAAVLARKAGKPVHFSLSRAENFINRTHQFPLKATIKVGVKNDGTITAFDSFFWGDAGAASRNRAAGGHDTLRYTYNVPDALFQGLTSSTNKPVSGAYRCVQHPQGAYIAEIVIDRVAESVGMNPKAFRLKNVFGPDDAMDIDSGRPLGGNGIKECIEKMTDAIGWDANWHAPNTRTLPDGRMHGMGMSAHIDGHGGMSSARGAIVNMNRDGTALINAGISRAGGGSNSAFCAIVAERIGLNYDDVNTGDWGNTDVCSDGGSQGGSKQVITSGSAFYNAATDVREQLFADVADELGVTPAELDAADGKIFVKADPTQFVTHADAVTSNSYTTIGRGYSWAEELVWKPMAGFPIGTRCEVRGVCGSAVEVAVDTETGEVEILKFANAVDNGKAASLAGSLNQIDGGTEIMIGEAMYFDQITDPATGATINASYIDSKFPTTLDIHGDRHTAIIVESDDACGPFGAKGMGEPSISSYGCLANAIYNAIGVWINDPPIYPQKILKALGKA